MARAFSPLPFLKRGNGAEVPFHHRCRSRQMFEGFSPNFPKLARKAFCATSPYIFSTTKIMKTSFWCNLQKKVFMYFYANFRRHFLKSNNVGPFFAQIFSKSKLLGMRLQPMHPHLKHHCFS